MYITTMKEKFNSLKNKSTDMLMKSLDRRGILHNRNYTKDEMIAIILQYDAMVDGANNERLKLASKSQPKPQEDKGRALFSPHELANKVLKNTVDLNKMDKEGRVPVRVDTANDVYLMRLTPSQLRLIDWLNKNENIDIEYHSAEDLTYWTTP